MKTLAVVQHTSSEYLGLIEDHLEGRRIRFRYFRPFTAGGKLPGPVDLGDGLVLLGGGPFGATPGAHCLPTLGQEVALTAAVLAAGGDVRAAPFVFEVGTASRTREDALGGYLPARYPLVRYGRDEPVLPPHARVLARDDVGRPALFECGQRAFGFSGHPGAKSAMIEDLIMEFAAAPADPEAGLLALRAARVAIEDALVPIMTGLVQCTGLMADAADGPSARPGVPGG